jgi:hypothetical protein
MNINQIINEEISNIHVDNKIKCLQALIKIELEKYDNNYDDRWDDLRQEYRNISIYLDNGYFLSNKAEDDAVMNNFLSGLNYSDNHTYKQGEVAGILKNSGLKIYKAIGDKTLFRGVSLADWERIKNQGYIDSDMRGAIFPDEGINLSQTPSTASYYLPAPDKGVILAINPNGLDKYMLRDEYIRIFKPIPIRNIIKVSDIISTGKYGEKLSTDIFKKVAEIEERLKLLGINNNC